jgi:hypothetical protein
MLYSAVLKLTPELCNLWQGDRRARDSCLSRLLVFVPSALGHMAASAIPDSFFFDFVVDLIPHHLSNAVAKEKCRQQVKDFIIEFLKPDFSYKKFEDLLKKREAAVLLVVTAGVMLPANREQIIAARPDLAPSFYNQHIYSMVKLVAPNDSPDRTNGPVVRRFYIYAAGRRLTQLLSVSPYFVIHIFIKMTPSFAASYAISVDCVVSKRSHCGFTNLEV